MGIKTYFNKFTAGEIDPKFLGEVDYDGYRKGARRMRNVLCTPQGSAEKRFGTKYEVSLRVGLDFITNPDEVKIIAFEYLNSEIFWIVLRANGLGGVAADIYLDVITAPETIQVATFQTTVNVLGTYTPAEIDAIRWVEDVNKLILLHESHPPLLLQRNAANNWVSADAVFSFYPVEDFSTIDNPTNNYTNNGTTFTPNAANATTITASTAVFTSNHAGIPPNGGGAFIGNGGVFRIVSVNAGGTVATGYSTEDFVDTSAIKGSESSLTERAWGDGSVIGGAPAGISRGYPRHGAFFQSRLVLGGSVASPGTAYASEVKDFFSFNNTEFDIAAGWGIEAGATGTDFIEDIISSKSLILLTNRGSSATSILVDTPTGPSNVFLNSQGQEPCRNMDAIILNNQVLYADFSGNTIWAMVYDVPDTGYSIFNASIISSHLIRNPQWAQVYDPAAISGRYYLMINDDGTLAIYNTIIEENIKSWSLAQTVGRFVDIAAVASQAMVLTERQINTIPSNGFAQALYTVDDTFNVFRNITPSVDAGNAVGLFMTDGDYLLIGNEIRFFSPAFAFAAAASQDLNLTFEFLANTGNWEEFDPIDLTSGMTTDGFISWTYAQTSNWERATLLEVDRLNGDELNYYWVRIKRNNDSALATGASASSILLDTLNIIHMERLTFDYPMDMVTNSTSDSNGIVTGLGAYAGQDVFVFFNDFPIGTFFVDVNGSTILTYSNPNLAYANGTVRLGIECKPLLIPMPIVSLLQNGYSVYDPVKIKNLYIDFYETLGLQVVSQNVPQIEPGLFITDRVPVPTSEYYLVPCYQGWNPRDDVIITQSYPAPFTIRGISYEVEVT